MITYPMLPLFNAHNDAPPACRRQCWNFWANVGAGFKKFTVPYDLSLHLGVPRAAPQLAQVRSDDLRKELVCDEQQMWAAYAESHGDFRVHL